MYQQKLSNKIKNVNLTAAVSLWIRHRPTKLGIAGSSQVRSEYHQIIFGWNVFYPTPNSQPKMMPHWRGSNIISTKLLQ